MTERNQHNKTKQATIISDSSSPEARGARLRRLRNMANLSRYEMCDSDALNINTYKGWEIARYGGLPANAVDKVIKRLSKAGVISTKQWILEGTGHEPYILPQPRLGNPNSFNDDLLIIKEITAFSSHYTDTIYTKINDDAMLPYFNQGDYVAGFKKYNQDINSLLNSNCIILTDAGELLVRYLKQGSAKRLYSLFHSNIETTIADPVMVDIRIEYAAKIARHYIK